MDGFTVVDAGVAVIVLMSAILAYSRGLVREVFAILGWVAAAALAFVFAHQAEPLIKQIPVLDKFLGSSCELSIIASYAAVFAGALIVVSIITPLFASVVQGSALSGVDRGLGFLFGVARGVLLIAVAFVVYDRMIAPGAVPAIDKSRSAQVFASFQGQLNDQMPTDAPGWIAGRYNALVGDCGAPDAAVPSQTAPAADPAGTATVPSTNNTGAKTVTP
jgi:membrane protein required for colicin V production